MSHIKKIEAGRLGICRNCTGQSDDKEKGCTAGRLPSLNYRNISADECFYTAEEARIRAVQVKPRKKR